MAVPRPASSGVSPRGRTPLPAIADQLGHQLMRAQQASDEAQGLLFGQDRRQPFGAFGAQGIHGVQILVEHLAVEEQGGAESSWGRCSVIDRSLPI
jgi:hypothetical protein